MSYNMILFIKSQMKYHTKDENIELKIINRKRIKRVILLGILLIFLMFITFLGNYLIESNKLSF
jgi:magnesium-transporting ATPase (P-type)